MTSSFSASVLKSVFEDIEENEGQINQSHADVLYAVGDFELLQAAIELVEKNKVTLVTALPSSRYFYQVKGTSPSSSYLCFSHYCSCPQFLHHVSKTKSNMCKHIAAIQLAQALSKYDSINIQDQEYADWLTQSRKVNLYQTQDG